MVNRPVAVKSSVRLRRPAPCAGPALPLGSSRREPPKIRSMRSFIILVDTVIEIYIWILIASAILSWLVAFGVVNTYNRFVNTVGETLYRLTEPALRPIRNFLPNLGGVDISPMVLILLLFFLRNLLYEYLL
jgi:YggT family protein